MKSRLWNVWAVIDGAPIQKINKKPLDRQRAEDEAGRLKNGKTGAKRVLITRA